MQNKNEYKGYSLFNDIEDQELKARNRGVVMANMVDIHAKHGKITPKGAALVLGYAAKIDKEERNSAVKMFEQRIYEMGYRHEAT